MAQDFKELVVWQKAVEVTIAVYKLTQKFPKDEIYGLTSQMRVQVCRLQATLPRVVEG